jgi:hypothetical protein
MDRFTQSGPKMTTAEGVKMNSNIWQMDTNANKKMIKEMKMEMKNDATPDLIEKLQLQVNPARKEMSEATGLLFDRKLYMNARRENDLKKRLLADVKVYRDLPHEDLVRPMYELMGQCWIWIFRLPLIFLAHAKMFHPSDPRVRMGRMCRIVVNALSPLRGGSQDDNNALEGSNNVDKVRLDRRRLPLHRLLSKNEGIPSRAEQASRKDLVFWRDMHKAVDSIAFYKECFARLDEQNLFTFLTVPLKRHSSKLDNDITFIPQKKYLLSVVDAYKGEQGKVIAQLKKGLTEYKRLLELGVRSTHDDKTRFQVLLRFRDYDFDEAKTILTYFHMLRPIDARNDLQCQMAIKMLHSALERSKVEMMSSEEIIALGELGLVSCTCPDYLHHAWSLHAFCTAKKRGIVKDYPRLKYPSAREGTKLKGRPRLAAAGQALKPPTPKKRQKRN